MITPLTETQALTEDGLVREAQRGESCRTWLLRRARAAVVRRHRRGRRSAWSRRVVRLAASSAFMLLLLPVAGLVYYVYFDRSGLPDLERFIRFEPPTIGTVYDARNKVLIELAREYRRVISYDEVPVILRQAILAAEDKNFFSHSGVEYRALPRVVHKMAAHYLVAWWNAEPGLRLRFPQGGSTLTQQLVRGYFLQDRTSQEDGNALFREGLTQRLFAAGLGVPATNKLFRKLKEVRLALWLEEEMRRRYRSQEQAKREIFVRYANFLYLGNGRYGFAAASEYYFGKPLSSYTPEDAGKAALLAGITKSPGAYAPVPGDPRPLRRRNQILALMARNGYIPEGLAQRCQAEPVRVAAHGPVKTHAPAAIESVFAELKQRFGGRFGVEDLVQGRISVRSTVDERVQTVVNEALENGLGLYEKRHARAKGVIQGSVVVLSNADAADPGRGGRAAGLQGPHCAQLRLQSRHGLAAAAGLCLEAARLPGRVSRRPEPRHQRARRAHRVAHGRRSRGEVHRQLRQPFQGRYPDALGPGGVPKRGGRVDHPRDRPGQGVPDRPGAGDTDPTAALHHHGARGVGGAAARAGRCLSRHGLRCFRGPSRPRSRGGRRRRGAL
jgi:Transglycosylase